MSNVITTARRTGIAYPIRAAWRVLILCLLVVPAPALAAGYDKRPDVRAFIDEMADKHGFDRLTLRRLFARTKPIPSVLAAIAPPRDPGIRSWTAYQTRFVEPKRITLGLSFWHSHRAALAAARALYGVPEEIIVAIIGVESIYGRNSGAYSTLAALATLAFDYPPRAPLFRHELEELLLLARETRRNVLDFKGSYAGALGLPQFLPSSVRRYGVDADHDGRIDLDTSTDDAIASVANFLGAHGWIEAGPIAAPAQVDGVNIGALIDEGITPKRTPSELAPWGVAAPAAPEAPAALIELATPQQPPEYRLGYQNFYVLTRYNRSSFYAMAVNDLAQALRARSEHEADER